jgi:hypothetical protein
VSQANPAQAGPGETRSPAVPDQQFNQVMQAVGSMLESITPWLVEFGSWIFGGLIAVISVVLAALITVGPVDLAVIVGTTALALALPLDVAGVLLLRLDQDFRHVGFEEEWVRAFRDAGITSPELVSPEDLKPLRKRRTAVVLRFCLGMLMVSIILILIGLVATLWHMAWWIGVAFLAMVGISQGIVVGVMLRLEPPDTPERREQRRRQRAEMIRQARQLAKKREEGA